MAGVCKVGLRPAPLRGASDPRKPATDSLAIMDVSDKCLGTAPARESPNPRSTSTTVKLETSCPFGGRGSWDPLRLVPCTRSRWGTRR